MLFIIFSAQGAYHINSHAGTYQLTLQQAHDRCIEDGTVLATYEQVAYAYSRGK